MPDQQLQPEQEHSDAKRRVRRRVRIALLAVATILLFTLLFVQAAFDTLPWLRPDSASEAVILYALSTINFLAFVVLLMVLVRNIIKLRRERRQMKLGAKFKTRLVVYFISLSLLPVIFLFFATSSIISRSVEKWFSEPAIQMVMNARGIESDYVRGEQEDLERLAATLARLVAGAEPEQIASIIKAESETQRLAITQLYDQQGRLIAEQAERRLESFDANFRAVWRETASKSGRGATYSDDSSKLMYLIASAPVLGERGGRIAIAKQVSPDFAERINKINRLQGEYDALKCKQKWMKTTA
ncbi:MAG: hypothetical protein ACREAM_08230, partial [Blastocatellia bacterium]